MRVLHINSLFAPDVGGGAEISLAAITTGLVNSGVEVYVACLHGGTGVVREVRNGVNVIRFPIKNIYWHVREVKQPIWKRLLWHAIDSFNPFSVKLLNQLVEEIQPDVISFHNLSGFSCSALTITSRNSVPAVQILHDYYRICPRGTMFRHGNRCTRQCTSCLVYRLPMRLVKPGITAVVGISNAVLDAHLAQGFFTGAALKRVIYNTHQSPPAKRIRTNVASRFTFGFIGTLNQAKGIELLLASFRKLLAITNKPLCLLVAGRGESNFVKKLHKEYEESEIIFVGDTSPAEFFPQLDVSVIPSLWDEPLGRVIFESMCFDIPVIGARRGGIPEVIQDGVNGLLFEPDLSDELLRAMLRIVESPRELANMKLNAAPSVSRFLDSHQQIADYLSVFSALTGESARALSNP